MDAKGVQEMMYKRLEFSELETDAEPQRIRPGSYFPYQELGQRYMFPYDHMLCIMEPGTGKTCFNIGIAEKVRMIQQWVDTTLPLRSNIKRCYVLTDSKLLVSEFNYQFICRCTDGRYMSEGIASAGKSTGRTLQINAIVGEFYEVKSYYDFNGQIRDLTEDQIIERYSDCMFFLDEVHTFRNSDRLSQRATDLMYTNIHRLVHIAKRIKLVLNTATPMVDNVNEIIPLINLIVPLDQQISEVDQSPEQYAELLKGKVMFVRSRPFRLNVIENGIDLLVSDVSTRVVPVLMSEFQTLEYFRDYGTRRYTDNSYLSTIQKATFYSDDTTLNKVSDGKGQQSMVVNEGFVDVLDDIGTFSAKYDYLLRYIDETDGTHYIYWNYLEGGLNIIAALLLTAGYERFTGMTSPFQREVTSGTRRSTSVMSEYCVSTNEQGQSVFTEFAPTFTKRPRFAILSGSNKDVHSRLIKEAMVHPDNLDGDYIKILIVSPVGKLGINLNNISHVHTIGAHWNKGNEIQAEGRAIRSESHIDLYNRLVSQREYNISHGLPLTPQQESLMVDISVNRYCAIPRYLDSSYLASQGLSYDDPTDELFEFLMDNIANPQIVPHLRTDIEAFNNTELDIERYPLSIDEYMYRLGVQKEIRIRRMIRIMKRLAVDCNNNIARNLVVDGEDGSLVCDYEACEYTCLYDPAVEDPTGELKGTVQDSYAALYMDGIIQKSRAIIDRAIGSQGYIGWSDVVTELDERDAELAVRHEVFHRIVGEYDQQYRVDRDGMPVYTVCNQYGVWTTNYLSTLITGNVIGDPKRYLEKLPLARVIERLDTQLFTYTDEDINNIVNNHPSMTLARKVAILERGILDGDERVTSLFDHYIFDLPRKSLRTYRVGNRVQHEAVDVPGERALIHMFPSETINTYIVSSLFQSVPRPASKSRIYEDGRWRNMNVNDYILYLEDMQSALDDRVGSMLDRRVFAYTNLIDYRLRLINLDQHDEYWERRGGASDPSMAQPRGLLCFNWNIDLLGESLYSVDPEEFMLSLLGTLQYNRSSYQTNINRYVTMYPEYRPLIPYFDRAIDLNRDFTFDQLERDEAVTVELMTSLARILYDDIDDRRHVRFENIDWTPEKLTFMILLLLTYPSSTNVCRDLPVESIFDDHGRLYRM